eukprot:346469-Amphidinium_carterae.1
MSDFPKMGFQILCGEGPFRGWFPFFKIWDADRPMNKHLFEEQLNGVVLEIDHPAQRGKAK